MAARSTECVSRWDLIAELWLSNLHAFQSGVLYMAETATVTRGRPMHACALLTQCCHGRSSSSGLHAQAQRTGSWAQLPGPVLSKAGQQRYGGGVREKEGRGGERKGSRTGGGRSAVGHTGTRTSIMRPSWLLSCQRQKTEREVRERRRERDRAEQRQERRRSAIIKQWITKSFRTASLTLSCLVPRSALFVAYLLLPLL